MKKQEGGKKILERKSFIDPFTLPLPSHGRTVLLYETLPPGKIDYR